MINDDWSLALNNITFDENIKSQNPRWKRYMKMFKKQNCLSKKVKSSEINQL